MQLQFLKKHRSFYHRMTKAKYQKIEEILRNKIISGHYKVGALIPKELDLVAKYHVSRQSCSSGFYTCHSKL